MRFLGARNESLRSDQLNGRKISSIAGGIRETRSFLTTGHRHDRSGRDAGFCRAGRTVNPVFRTNSCGVLDSISLQPMSEFLDLWSRELFDGTFDFGNRSHNVKSNTRRFRRSMDFANSTDGSQSWTADNQTQKVQAHRASGNPSHRFGCPMSFCAWIRDWISLIRTPSSGFICFVRDVNPSRQRQFWPARLGVCRAISFLPYSR